MLIAQQQCSQPPIARLRAATVNSACSAHLPPLPSLHPPAVLHLILLLPLRFQVSSVSSESLFTVVAIVFAVIIIAVASVLRLRLLPLLLLLLSLVFLNIAWPALAYP